MQSQKPPATGRTSRRHILGAYLGAVVLGLPGAARAAHTVRPWLATKPTPSLELTDLEGKAWTLGAVKGRPVVLNFWASWCEPCRAEMPSLERLQARHAKAGLVVLSVNYREPPATIRRFLDTVPFALPILLDRDGEAAGAWTPRVFPSTVLIDRSGAPRNTVIGELDWLGESAGPLIEPLLARTGAG